MTQRAFFSTLFVLFVSIFLVTAVFAQGVTGTVKGQMVDAAGAGVSGMTVALSDTSKGLTRTVTTNAAGRFQLQLAPGIYVLKSSGSGYAEVTVEQVSVNVAAATELTIPAAIEEIIVYGTAEPLMATATGEASLNISLEELSRLPVSRSIEAVAMLAPGTVPGIDSFGDDKTLVSFGGASVAENVYYIDGLNVSNFRTGMGGSSVPFEFYGEFQIKTGGYSAEFGRSTGGVINAVTRRGGNEFEYGVVSYLQPESLQGTSPNTMRPDGSYYDFNSKNTRSSMTTDIYFGGPIIKDRLFFFALYEPRDLSAEYNRRGSADTLIKEKIGDNFWGGNLTWNITDNHSLSYTAFSDERDIAKTLYAYDIDSKKAGDLIGDSTGYRGGDNYIVSYGGQVSDKFMVSALYGSNRYLLSDLSSNDDDCPLAVDVSDGSTAVLAGCWVNSDVFVDSDEREAYRLDFEYIVGAHSLRAGFDKENNVSSHVGTYPGLSLTPNLPGGVYYRYNSWDVGDTLRNGTEVPDVNGDGSRVDTVRYRYQSFAGSFDTKSFAWYIEDTWEVNEFVTLSAGIRNEKYENFNGVGDLFLEIEDQWAPRLALVWTPGETTRQRISLNWGRYHLPMMSWPVIGYGNAYTEVLRYFVYDGNRDARTAAPIAIDDNGLPTTQELGTAFILGDGSVADTRSALDSSLKPMFQDEWIVAYEREFGADWVAGVRYVNRELQSLIEDVLTDAGLEAIDFPGTIGYPGQDCAYVMTNPGTDMTTFCDSDGDGVLEETFIPADALGYPKARRSYKAVEITVHKSFSNDWALQASYTWSKNEGNTEGSVKSDNGQDGANLTTDFDFPELMDGANGYLPNDRRHKLKLWGSYEVTDHLTLGANLFAQSGRPINAFGEQHPNGGPLYGSTYYLEQPDGSFKFMPRGSSGRTDWVTKVDLAAIYAFDWGRSTKVELRADIFNLFDSDAVTEVYEYPEERPDQFKLPMHYQQPRYLRFGAAVRF